MNDYEIIEHTIRKTLSNGWNASEYLLWNGIHRYKPEETVGLLMSKILVVDNDKTYHEDELTKLITHQDFALALWGEGHQIEGIYYDGWQNEVQQFVISTDKVGFLKEHA